jgi:hypothetical protein
MRSFRRVTPRVAPAIAAVASIVLLATCDLDKITSTTKPLDQNAIRQLFSIAPDSLVTLAGTLTLKLGAGSKVDATHQVLWRSNNTNVATVDSSSGLLSGLAIGTATIVARYIAAELDTEYTQSLAVRVRYKGIKVATIDSIAGLGLSRAVAVNGTNNANAIQVPAITTATLSTHDSGSTASTFTAISGQTVVGKKPGRAYVVALFDGFRDSLIVRMRQVAKSITFPTTDYVATAINANRLVPLTVKDVADSVITSPTLSWSVSDTLVATIGASTGVLKVKKNDTTRIFVTMDTVTRSQKLTVQQQVWTLNKMIGDAQSDTVAQTLPVALQVTALDTGGTAVPGATVTFRVGSGAGTLTDSVQTTDASGHATLGAWMLGPHSGSQTVIVTSGSATSTFTATAVADAPSRVGFIAQPTSTPTATAIAPAIQVSVQDSLGNTNTGATNTIALALSNNPSGAILGGTLSAAAVAGVATFSDITVDKGGTSYTLQASSGGLASGISNSFDAFGSAANLAFITQPVGSSAGGVMPAVRVAVQDAQGNIVANSTQSVTVAIGTNPASGTLGGTLTVSAVNGIATFSNLSVSVAASGYTLTAAGGSLTTGTSSAFTVTAVGPASKLIFSAQPSNVVAGASIGPAIKVQVLDANGALVTSSSQQITLAIDANPGNGTLSGTVTQTAASGEATFSNISINKSGSGYTLSASAPGTSITNVGSSAFNVTTGTASKLGFVVQPTHTPVNATMAPAVQVAVQDQFGNTVTTGTPVSVQLALSGTGAVLTGGGAANTANGVVSFSGLSINTTGTYTLTASASGASLTNGTSNPFAVVVAGGAIKLGFSTQPPTTATAGTNLTAYTVALQDANGNTVPATPTQQIQVSVLSGPGVISGTLSVSTSSGVATFSSTQLQKAGTYKLLATSGSYDADSSTAITVAPAAADRVNFIQQPANIGAGVPFSPVIRAAVQDAFGNTVTSASNTLQVSAFISGVGTAVPLGTGGFTASAPAVSGVATFTGLTIKKATTGVRLNVQAPSTSFFGFSSNIFDITAGPVVALGFVQQPTTTQYTQTISPAVTVQGQDSVGNLISDFGNTVTLALTGGTGGAVLGGTLTGAPSGGIATFSNLTVDRAGVGYSLSASASGVSTSASNTFAVTVPAIVASSQGGTTSMLASGTNIYFTNPAGSTLSSVSKLGGAVTSLGAVAAGSGGIQTDGTSLYWADSTGARICKMPIAGGTCTVVVGSLTNLIKNSLIIDGANLYFVAQQGSGVSYAIRRVATAAASTAADVIVLSTTMPVFTISGGNIYFYNPNASEIRSIVETATNNSPASVSVTTSVTLSTTPSQRSMAVGGSNLYFIASTFDVKTVPTGGGTATTRASGIGCSRGDFVVDGSTSIYYTDGCSGIHRMNQSSFADTALPQSANAPGVTLVFDGSDIFYFDGANLKKTPK